MKDFDARLKAGVALAVFGLIAVVVGTLMLVSGVRGAHRTTPTCDGKQMSQGQICTESEIRNGAPISSKDRTYDEQLASQLNSSHVARIAGGAAAGGGVVVVVLGILMVARNHRAERDQLRSGMELAGFACDLATDVARSAISPGAAVQALAARAGNNFSERVFMTGFSRRLIGNKTAATDRSPELRRAAEDLLEAARQQATTT